MHFIYPPQVLATAHHNFGLFANRCSFAYHNDWEDMDDRARWARKEKDEKGFYTVDLVERFFSNIDLR